MSLKERIKSQFGHPRGALGHLVGYVIAHAGPNPERSRQTVARLGIRGESRVLEIGFGPGLAIGWAAEVATDGLVAGVEVSEVMLRQALRRNSRAVAEGRVDLRLASADALPDFGAPFDIVFAVNSAHHWPDVPAALGQVGRVLRSEGRLVVVEQPRCGSADTAQAHRRGQAIAEALRATGFEDVEVETLELKPVIGVLVAGVTP